MLTIEDILYFNFVLKKSKDQAADPNEYLFDNSDRQKAIE